MVVPPSSVTPRENRSSGTQPPPGPSSASQRAADADASTASSVSFSSTVVVDSTFSQPASSAGSSVTRQPSRSPARRLCSSSTTSEAPASTMRGTSGPNSPTMPMRSPGCGSSEPIESAAVSSA
ncbi:MAG: hypothetical protein DCC72_12335 [Burkholderiales bacterium]|nr:MAG: hypothetical protein DCC72_12335 [Burkholderiales bacterium]